jgi:Bacterial PH domain
MQGHVVEYQGQQVAFDQQGQLDKIIESLMPGEQVFAVYDAIGAGTGFIGVTDKRVIIQDNSYVGKKIALVSIPFSRISSVSVLSNKSMFGSFFSSSQIVVSTASKAYEVEFRGDGKAKHVHDLILWKIL